MASDDDKRRGIDKLTERIIKHTGGSSESVRREVERLQRKNDAEDKAKGKRR